MALFVLSLCPFDISVGVGAFVIGLSQISSFLSLNLRMFDTGHILSICLIFSFCNSPLFGVLYSSTKLKQKNQPWYTPSQYPVLARELYAHVQVFIDRIDIH